MAAVRRLRAVLRALTFPLVFLLIGATAAVGGYVGVTLVVFLLSTAMVTKPYPRYQSE